jgi:hypothetical protein
MALLTASEASWIKKTMVIHVNAKYYPKKLV